MLKASADIIVQNYQKAVQLKEVVSYESEIFIYDEDPKQLKERYFESRVSPVFNNYGQCEHINAITHDITERKKQEQDLKLEKAKLDLIYNYAADAVFTFNANGNYGSVNPGFTKLLGWEEEELLTDSSLSIIPNEYKDDLSQIIHKLKNGEVIENYLLTKKREYNQCYFFIHTSNGKRPISRRCSYV